MLSRIYEFSIQNSSSRMMAGPARIRYMFKSKLPVFFPVNLLFNNNQHTLSVAPVCAGSAQSCVSEPFQPED